MIIVFGEALIDMIMSRTADGEKAFVPHTGGSPFNTCIALARLGIHTGFAGRVSTDLFGKMLISDLENNGVDLSYTQRGAEPTTLGFVKTSPGTDPEYAFYTAGTADCSLKMDEFPENFPESTEALVFGSISLLMEPGASVIEGIAEREKGKRVFSFDPNIRPVLIDDGESFRAKCKMFFGFSTIVKVSDVDLKWLYPELSLKEAASKVKSLGPVIVAVTMGREGSFAVTDGFTVEASAVKVNVADTVGAGDTFHAGFLAYLSSKGLMDLGLIKNIDEKTLTDALRFASRCAAVTCSRKGADPPYADEL